MRAVVTGASSGIGAAIAEAFAGAGAQVLVTYRSSEAEAAAVAERIGAARRPGRPGHARRLRGARGGEQGTARRARRVGEQRGRGRAHGRGSGLGLGAQARPPARGRPQGDGGLLLRRRRRHGGAAGRRDDPQHELGPRDRRNGRREPGAVQRGQGRRARLQQEPCSQPGAPGARERAVPRMDRDRVRAGGPARLPRSVAESTPLAAGAGPRTWPRRRFGSRRRRPPSSPARPSTSTVAL